MCKTLSPTCPSRINLTQMNNFTVKSVEGVFYRFDSLIACGCNCSFQTIYNNTCWQLHSTTVTLSRLFKKQTECNVTGLGIDKVIRTHHQSTVRRHFRKQGTQRSEIHYHSTRLATSKNLFLPRVNSSSGKCSLLRQLASLLRAVGELVRRNLRNALWLSFA